MLPLPEHLLRGAGGVVLEAPRAPVEIRKSSNGMICARFVPGEAAWDARCYHESFITLLFRSREPFRQGKT